MVTEEGIQECSNCFFYQKGETSGKVECKRYPPNMNDYDPKDVLWSQPKPEEWCGEWRGRRK